jgi:hypothetical protein
MWVKKAFYKPGQPRNMGEEGILQARTTMEYV